MTNSLHNMVDTHNCDLTERRPSGNNFCNDDSKTVDVSFLREPDDLVQVGGTTTNQFRGRP